MLTREQIREAAMKLGPQDREALAEDLLLSISDEERDAVDRAWLDEVRRRDAEFAAGRTNAKPIDDVMRRLESRIT